MDSDVVLEVTNLSKRFSRDLKRSLLYAVADIAGELAPWRARSSLPRSTEFLALDSLSFELRRGEALGVIGSNGAGKSTLLKILYGLMKPDGGKVRIRGTVAALIELGTGFEPVLTGRENIALNGAIVGLSKQRLAQVTDAIVDFAELDDAIDAPVRYYSSGMSARLAFAIAAHVEPDLLILDEVLAVGDIAFQRKCAVHMQQYVERGGSLIFVSHSPYQVQAVCSRGLLLDEGRCTFSGTAVETLSQHLGVINTPLVPGQSVADRSGPTAQNPVVIDEVVFAHASSAADPPRTDEPARLTVHCRSLTAFSVLWGFGIFTGDQWICVTGAYDFAGRKLATGRGRLEVMIPRLSLTPGQYVIRIGIADAATHQPLAHHGHDDAPTAFAVSASSSHAQNAAATADQLTTLEVEWSPG